MYLGIEIGGTKLQFGVGAGDGSEFAAFERREVDLPRGGEGIREQIRDVGRMLIANHPIERIGIGFGGPVFGSRGIVQKSHQVAGWDNFPLASWCETELQRPTRLGNDCDCAALAEACFGAGLDKRTVFYITVGTGIGGGFVIDKTIYGTDRPAAAEIGHLRMNDGLSDMSIPVAKNSLSRLGAWYAGDVEYVAAGPGIAKGLQQLVDMVQDYDSYETEIRDLLHRCKGTWSLLTAKEIGEAAFCGNSLAKIVFGRATDVLGWAIAQMITLLSPNIVIIGGGVSLLGDEIFFQPIRTAVDQFVFEQLRGYTDIVPAQLGESVVVHGALALAAKASVGA
jgi:glucokinase